MHALRTAPTGRAALAAVSPPPVNQPAKSQSTESLVHHDRLRTLRDATRVAWSAPPTWLLLLCIGLSSAWAAHVSTLLRPGGAVLGPVLQALLWTSLFAVLVLFYSAAAPLERQSMRRLVHRIAVALLLALASTHLARLVLTPLLAPSAWTEYDHLRLLLPPLLAAVWCWILLPIETRSLGRAAAAVKTLTPLPSLLALFVVAAVFVSCTDLAFLLVRSDSSVVSRLAVDVLGLRPWLSTTVILFCAYAIVFSVTSSAAVSLLLVSPIYATMVFATLVKIRYIHSAVQPLDLLSVPEFMPLFGRFFGSWAIMAILLGIALWLAALVVCQRRRTVRVPASRRVAIGLVSSSILIALPLVFLAPNSNERGSGVTADLARAVRVTLGAPAGQHRERARSIGVVLTFLYALPSAFVTPPADYSPAKAARVLQTYSAATETRPALVSGGGVNLVVYLVESLMDPEELGYQFSSDPMPNLRALRRSHTGGYCIVPETFSGSANTEFEVLSGMTMSFLPERSLPYRQYVRSPIPSLPRTLRDMGYRTTAVQPDPRYYYDRERVYPLLGFDDVVWLSGAPGVERAARADWPSDDAVVDAVIAASSRTRPFFVFAFPTSTHSPYNFGAYRNSSLEVRSAPSEAVAAEVKEYANAVRVADQAIGRLIEHFRGRSDSTVIVVLGDHLPPLSGAALSRFFERVGRLSVPEQARAKRRVPLLVWSNFGLPREEVTLSVNMLPPFLLERVGAPREGLFAVTDSVRRTLPVTSVFVQHADGRMWRSDAVPLELRTMLADYRLVQHDVLFSGHSSLSDATQPRNGTPATGWPRDRRSAQ